MRALVTGAGGFVGQSLVRHLRGEGWDTTGVARRDAADISVFEGFGTAAFADLLTKRAPDVVFHAAGKAGRTPATELMRSNVVLTAELFDALESCGLRPTVVLVGSAAEYGQVEADDLPLHETRPCAPASDYAVSKHAQTLLGLSRAREGWPVIVARLFNPVGPGMPAHLALGDFAARLRRGDPVLHVGNLDVRRDFLEVGEAARLIVSLAMQPTARGRVINVCAGEAFHLGSLVDRMIELAGARTALSVDPARLRRHDPPVVYGSTEALRDLGLSPVPPDFEELLPRLLAAAA